MYSRSNTVRAQNMKPRQTAALVLFVFTSILPALLLTGFLPSFGLPRGSLFVWLIVALLGGALGGSLMAPDMRYWYVGTIAGVLIGAGMLLAIYYYTVFRSSILGIEIFIPTVIGALPGILFVWLVTALFGKKMRAPQSAALNVGQAGPATPYAPQPSMPGQAQQSFQPYYPPQSPALQTPASQPPASELNDPQGR